MRHLKLLLLALFLSIPGLCSTFVVFGSSATATKNYWLSSDGVTWSAAKTVTFPGTNGATVNAVQINTIKNTVIIVAWGASGSPWSIYSGSFDSSGNIGTLTEAAKGTGNYLQMACASTGCLTYSQNTNADNYYTADGVSFALDFQGIYTARSERPYTAVIGSQFSLLHVSDNFFYGTIANNAAATNNNETYTTAGLTTVPVAVANNPVSAIAVYMDSAGHTTHSSNLSNGSFAWTAGGTCAVTSPIGGYLGSTTYFFGTTNFCSSTNGSTFTSTSFSAPQAFKSMSTMGSLAILTDGTNGVYTFNGSGTPVAQAGSPQNAVASGVLEIKSNSWMLIVNYE